MRSTIVILIALLLSGAVYCQYEVEFISANQYRTISGWRIHFITGWWEILFPPLDFERVECLLSTYPLGIYPPYDPIAILERKIPERDPEFRLLGAMDTDVTWYCRLRWWAGESIYAETREFTFILPGGEENPPHLGAVSWVAYDERWTTSVAFKNPTAHALDLQIDLYSLEGELIETGILPLPPHATRGYYFNIPAEELPFYGSAEIIASGGPLEWQALLWDGEAKSWIPFNGRIE